jgi:hypothetical protein
MMMEAPHFRNLPHGPELGRLHWARDRSVHSEGSTREIELIVVQVGLEEALEMPFVQDDDMIEQLAADTPNQSLHV